MFGNVWSSGATRRTVAHVGLEDGAQLLDKMRPAIPLSTESAAAWGLSPFEMSGQRGRQLPCGTQKPEKKYYSYSSSYYCCDYYYAPIALLAYHSNIQYAPF